MDAVKASLLEQKLRGRLIECWRIEQLINFGKSAAVFRAVNGNMVAAIKIFDDELIDRYGDKTQLGRIERELNLIGKSHPNMVKILGGGIDKNTNNHYIVMEYISGPNLASCINDVPFPKIPLLIKQLASAARFLESSELVHRDIKPENIIVIEDYTKLILLDFGVLRPFGISDLTDGGDVLSFVGTLRYSSPEFLLRKEEDSIEGWRALTFYQISGVLHDLLMRKPLFEEATAPYARLVNAVQFEQPEIQNPLVHPKLIKLAQSCLIKDPKVRVKLVNWPDFEQDDTANQGLMAYSKKNVTSWGELTRAKLEKKTNSNLHNQQQRKID
jgi:eukaryotic-like serine/threonine-protein kinase